MQVTIAMFKFSLPIFCDLTVIQIFAVSCQYPYFYLTWATVLDFPNNFPLWGRVIIVLSSSSTTWFDISTRSCFGGNIRLQAAVSSMADTHPHHYFISFFIQQQLNQHLALLWELPWRIGSACFQDQKQQASNKCHFLGNNKERRLLHILHLASHKLDFWNLAWLAKIKNKYLPMNKTDFNGI